MSVRHVIRGFAFTVLQTLLMAVVAQAQWTPLVDPNTGQNLLPDVDYVPLAPESVTDPTENYAVTPLVPALTPELLEYAKSAWRYFQANEDPQTGLVSAVNNFSSTTLWDEGGYLLAIVAAHRLGVITRDEGSARVGRVLNSFAQAPLFQGVLPNKVYNTKSLRMTNYANKETPNGVGWSALDIMRFVSGMLVATQEFPEHLLLAQALINRWELRLLVSRGRFQGIAVREEAHDKYVQEGRIGYEQYAGRIGVLVGLPVELAEAYAPILRWQPYFDIRLPGDKRTKSSHGVSSVTTSEPFLLEALEYGWRQDAYAVASAVYEAQRFRYKTTGQLTSLSEDHIKGKPYFAYNAILVDEVPFISVTSKRADVSNKRGISTKASFGWWALMDDAYGAQLVAAIRDLQSDRGWYAGLFEADGSPNEILTLNTNAVVLEALHYRVFGPLYRF